MLEMLDVKLPPSTPLTSVDASFGEELPVGAESSGTASPTAEGKRTLPFERSGPVPPLKAL